MELLTKRKVMAALDEAVAAGTPDDLGAYHTELFPRETITLKQVEEDPERFRDRIKKHLTGAEIETIIDLWNVTFVGRRCIGYDEETKKFEIREKKDRPDEPELL